MAIERVRAQKMETTNHGGNRVDQVTSEVDPQSEYYDALGYAVQRAGTDDGNVYVSRSTDDQLSFTDAVNGTVKLATLLANSAGISALTGDVAATGPGSANATVNQVGGQAKGDIAQVTAALKGSFTQSYVAAAPSSGNGALTPRLLVAADIPALPYTQITGLKPSAYTDTTNASNITSGTLPSNQLSGSYTGITAVGTLTAGAVPVSLLAPGTATAGQVPTYSGSAVAWATPTAYLNALTGDVAASGSGSQPATVKQVGGSLAQDVNQVTAALKGSFAQNLVVASPNGSNGALAPRALVAADVPTLPYSQISGLQPSAYTDTTNAANISQGTLPTGRLAGSYTGITAVGALTAGSIPPALISTANASSGQVLQYNGSSVVFATVSSGGGAVTYPLQATDGSASAPSFSFANSTGTGMYNHSNALGLSSGGTDVLYVSGNFLILPLRNAAPQGASGAPGWSFVSGGQTGMYSTVNTQVGLTANGTAVFNATTAGASLPAGLTSLPLLGSSSGTATINAAATTTSYTAVWPAAQGAASTVLTNDGSGNLSWAAAGGAAPTIGPAASNTSYPLLVQTGTNTYASTNTTNQQYQYTGFGLTAIDKPTTNTRNPTFLQYIWWNNGSSEAGSINMTAYAVSGSGGQANENIDLFLYRNEAPAGSTQSSQSVSTGSVTYVGSKSSLYGNVGSGVYLKGSTPYSVGTGGLFVQGNNLIALGANALSTSTNTPLNSAAFTVLGGLAAKGALYLNGATSGYVSLAAPATATSYPMVLPSAQGTAGQTLLNDGAGNLSWGAAAATGTVVNGAGTVPQRDATGALLYSQAIVQVSASGTQSPAFTNSNNEYQYSGTSGNMTVQLYTPPLNTEFPIVRASILNTSLTPAVVINPQNNGYTYYPGGNTAGTLASKTLNAAIKLTAQPQNSNSVANWTVESMLGVWYDNSANVYVTSSFVADQIFTGSATAQANINTLVLRPTAATGYTNLFGINCTGFIQGTKALQLNNLSAAPAASTGYAQWYSTTDYLPHYQDSQGNNYTILTNSGLTTHIAPVGTASAPGVSFLGNLNTGIFIDSSSQLGFSFAGVERMAITNSVAMSVPLSVTGTINGTTSLTVGTSVNAGTFVSVPASGSATACLYQVGAANTGLYYPATGNLALAAGGTQVGLFTSTSASFPNVTSVSMAAATAINFGAAVASFSSTAGSIQFPIGSTAIAATTDTAQGLVLASNFMRLNGPGGSLGINIGNQSSFYGVGIGVNPLTTAYNALAIAGAMATQETTQPATLAGYTHVFANSTDHHLYASNPTYGQVALTNGGVPATKSTTAATTTVTLANGDNNRLWMLDGTYAGTSTLNLPPSSTTTDQIFRVMQSQATYGGVVTAASGTNIQFDTVPSSSAGSVTWNANGAGFALSLPKGKTTWSLLYSTGAAAGTYTIS